MIKRSVWLASDGDLSMRIAVVVLLLFLPCARAHGQAVDATARPVLRDAAAGYWYLRIHTGDSTQIGRVRAVQRDTAFILQLAIPISQITLVERRHQKGGGTVPGALIGGGLFGLLGIYGAGLCDSSDCPGFGAAFVGAGAIGAILGMLIGSSVSYPEAEWYRIWP
jgi:hypothetical protein